MNSRRSAGETVHVSNPLYGLMGLGREKRHTLLRAVDELDAVLEELARHVEHLLDLVGHCDGLKRRTGIRLCGIKEDSGSNGPVRKRSRGQVVVVGV